VATGLRLVALALTFSLHHKCGAQKALFFVFGLNRQYVIILKIQNLAAHGANRGSYEAIEK
jgi:hypothetical protein